MNGKKVFSNEKRLTRIACFVWAAWTVCFVLIIPAALSEVEQGRFFVFRPMSKSDVYVLAFFAWGGGSCAIGGAAVLFLKAKYHIDYQGNAAEVFHSWPKKQLFVNGELQDENTDYSFSRVELRGRSSRARRRAAI